MKHLPRLTLAAALAATCACAEGAVASFRGLRSPVLLGPQDRIHQSGQPLPTVKVSEFNEQQTNVTTQVETRVGHREVSIAAADFAPRERMGWKGWQATANDPGLDIRINELEGTAWGLMFDAVDAEYVGVKGDVVRVRGVR